MYEWQRRARAAGRSFFLLGKGKARQGKRWSGVGVGACRPGKGRHQAFQIGEVAASLLGSGRPREGGGHQSRAIRRPKGGV